MDTDEVETYLSRSGNAGLSITVHESSCKVWDLRRFWLFFENVLKHSHRWTELKFPSYHEFWDIDNDFYEELDELLKGADVARLESLSMGFSFVEERDEDRVVDRFYKNWKIPKLRRLLVTEFVPASVFGSSLTTLQVVLPNSMYDSRFLLKDVVTMLASTPILEEFHFKVFAELSTFNCVQANNSVSLPRLRHLFFAHIEHFQAGSAEVMKTFMAVIHAPNLVTYGCGVSTAVPMRQRHRSGAARVDPEYSMSFFADVDIMANVQELRIHKGHYVDLPQPPLVAILRKTPRLCTLRFKELSLTEELDPLVGTLPPICDIYFDHCDVGAVFLRSCVNLLESGSRWSTFKAFHFRFCWGLSEKDVRAIISSEKMTWEDLEI
jgi:hypothetical protein